MFLSICFGLLFFLEIAVHKTNVLFYQVSEAPALPKPKPRKTRQRKQEHETPISSTPEVSIVVAKSVQNAERQELNGKGSGFEEDNNGTNSSKEKNGRREAKHLYDVPPKARKPLERSMAVDVPLYDKPKPPRKVPRDKGNRDMTSSMDDRPDEISKRNETAQSADDVTPLNTVIVDRRYYDYMCQFRRDDIDPVQKVCHVEVNPVRDGCDDVEVRFVRAEAGNAAEWQRQFIETYERMKEELVIERVDLTDIDNTRRYRDDLESRYPCLFRTAGSAIDIVCERRALAGIRTLTNSRKVNTKKQHAGLPAGYDIAGVFYVYLYTGDLTRLNADVVAFGTDEGLRHQFGVAKAMAEAGGCKLVQACGDHVRKANIQTSDVIRTTAGKLWASSGKNLMPSHNAGPDLK